MTFQCKKCKYKFERRDKNKTETPRSCPWCNTAGSVVPLKTADQLVKEIDELI